MLTKIELQQCQGLEVLDISKLAQKYTFDDLKTTVDSLFQRVNGIICQI